MDISVQARLGHAIREERHRSGLSQEELATKSGQHRTYISGIERGRRNVSLVALCKLAEGLEIAPSALLKAAGL